MTVSVRKAMGKLLDGDLRSRTIEELHAGVAAELCADDRSELVARGAQPIGAALGERLDAQERVGGRRGELGAVGLTPVPRAADHADVVAVDHLARLRRLICLSAERDEVLAARRAGEANVALHRRKVFA